MEENLINTELKANPESIILEGERDSNKSGEFTITNTGSIDFICRSVTKSCGCTMPTGLQPADIIKPGESIKLNFNIDLKTPGTKYIYVFGNADTLSLPIHLTLI